MRTCTLAGCNRKHKARGLCETHYRQEIRRNRPSCRIDDCDKPQFQRTTQLCETHYRQWLRTGSPHTAMQTGCSVPGCKRKHHAGDLCRHHYDQQR